MSKLCIIAGIVILSGCTPDYVQLPPVPAEIMAKPCEMIPPSANADDDLAIDVQNAECTRQLRLKVYRLQDWVKNVTQK